MNQLAIVQNEPSAINRQTVLRLGATEEEADLFFQNPNEDDFYIFCMLLMKQDRKGVFAHQKKRRAEKKQKYMANPRFRVENAMRARMYAALRSNSFGSLLSRLPYSIAELKEHLSTMFVDGMSWDNYGKWHVDHIKPCSLFDHKDESQVLQCWALKNLQPLWASDNIKKGAKYGSA